jgi:hypothetical protein
MLSSDMVSLVVRMEAALLLDMTRGQKYVALDKYGRYSASVHNAARQWCTINRFGYAVLMEWLVLVTHAVWWAMAHILQTTSILHLLFPYFVSKINKFF